MKIEKWNEKSARVLDTMINRENVRYFQRDDGVIFSDKYGFWFMFSAGSRVMRWRVEEDTRVIPALDDHYNKAINSNGVLADTFCSGYFTNWPYKIVKLSNDNTTVYAQEKFTRMFPKNALYYIESANAPVVVGIWEKGLLHVIGVIMPINKMYRDFIPAENNI